MLPLDDLVSRQVGNIGNADLSSGLDNHPSNVSPPEALVSRVWVKLGVGVSVVCSVSSGPPFDRSLNGTCTSDRKSVLKWDGSVVGSVSPKSVVTGGDTQTGDVVVDDADVSQSSRNWCSDCSPPDSRLSVVRSSHHTVDGDGRGDRDREEGDPLDVPEQVLPGDRRQVLLLLNGRSNIIVRDISVTGHERRLDRLNTSE